MSDPDAPNDPNGDGAVTRTPLDEAYSEAEAMLRDEDGRAARRDRVLAAVAAAQAVSEPPSEPDLASAPTAPSPPPARRTAWRPAPWLAAAGVAGIATLIGVRLNLPPGVQAPLMEPAPEPPASQAASRAEAVAPPSRPEARTAAPSPEPKPAPVSPPPPPPRLQPHPLATAADAPTIPPLPVPPVQARIEEPRPPAAARAIGPSAEMAGRALHGPVPTEGARLASAAIAGDSAEIGRLLAAGVPVDVADEVGETALMKAVRANRPAAAALLRRAGADPARRSNAGISAQDLAAERNDPRMDRALDVAP